jgi:hypothetical protein
MRWELCVLGNALILAGCARSVRTDLARPSAPDWRARRRLADRGRAGYD